MNDLLALCISVRDAAAFAAGLIVASFGVGVWVANLRRSLKEIRRKLELNGNGEDGHG